MKQKLSIKLDIAILGGGFGGVYCAKAIGKSAGRNSSVLISEDNYMVFQPMLPEVAGSCISPRHVVNPLRLLCRNADVMRGHVESIDWNHRSLVLNAGPFTGNLKISYEPLALAHGRRQIKLQSLAGHFVDVAARCAGGGLEILARAAINEDHVTTIIETALFAASNRRSSRSM